MFYNYQEIVFCMLLLPALLNILLPLVILVVWIVLQLMPITIKQNLTEKVGPRNSIPGMF